MVAAIFNIVIGGLLIAGGATGRFTIIFTDSVEITIAVGATIAGLGIFQLIKSRKK